MTDSINKYQDIIDSRDVISRIEDLESDVNELDEDDKAELKALKSLTEEAGGCSDWECGCTMVRETYFIEYAQELAEECGYIKKDVWPYTYIDWDSAAEELKQDYMEVDFDGIAYLAVLRLGYVHA